MNTFIFRLAFSGRTLLLSALILIILISQLNVMPSKAITTGTASTTTITSAPKTNKDLAKTLIKNAYPVWRDKYILSSGQVYAYDWSTYRYSSHPPMPNSALSEGQSYAMLMSAYMNDQATFDRVWKWTKANMQTRQDHLFNWWTATLPDGSYGPVYQDIAADGDEAIAFSLLIAGEKWGGTYTKEAKQIVSDLWKLVVLKAPNGKLYYASAVAGSPNYITNLAIDSAYLMPYVYRKFSQYDTVNSAGWKQLASDAYDTLDACAATSAAGLPPDWCSVNIRTGKMSAKPGSGFASDAKRVFWHVSFDASLGNPKAIAFLKNHPYLADYLLKNNVLPSGVTTAGQAIPDRYYSSGMMMLSLAQMNTVYPDKVQPTYHQDAEKFVNMFKNLWYTPTPSYYDPAVTWFATHAISEGKS